MFKFLWWIPLAAGFQDGVNPCILMTAALTLLGMLWLKRSGLTQKWVLLFLLTILLSSCFLNLGYLDQVILQKKFVEYSRLVYVILALIVAWKGFGFLLDWFKLVKNEKCLEVVVKKRISAVFLSISIVLSGFVLSFLAALWPINYYVTVFSLQMRGQSQLSVIFFIFSYTLMSLWIVYLVSCLSFVQNKNLRIFKIVSAAVLLSASFSVIDLFL